MPTYTYDHIHLRSRDPMETARYYNRVFDARIIESVLPDGQTRVGLDINGLAIYIAQADETQPPGPVEPHLGLDHFGLRVANLDEAATQLRERGAVFSTEPRQVRPGLRIAYVRGPDDVRIELVERG